MSRMFTKSPTRGKPGWRSSTGIPNATSGFHIRATSKRYSADPDETRIQLKAHASRQNTRSRKAGATPSLPKMPWEDAT